MPRVCRTCTHPERAKIDRLLAQGSAVKAQIAAEMGISESALGRHERECLDPALVTAAAKTAAAESGSLVARVTKMVDRLERLAESCTEYGAGKDLLAAARELRPYHELFGKANGQLANDRVTALFVGWGVRDEAEIERALELSRTGRDITPEAAIHDALQVLKILLPQAPQLAYHALATVQSECRAIGMLEPHTNGHGGLENGKDGEQSAAQAADQNAGHRATDLE